MSVHTGTFPSARDGGVRGSGFVYDSGTVQRVRWCGLPGPAPNLSPRRNPQYLVSFGFQGGVMLAVSCALSISFSYMMLFQGSSCALQLCKRHSAFRTAALGWSST